MKKETIEFALRTTWQQITNMYNEKALKYGGTMTMAFTLLSIDADGTPSTTLGPKNGYGEYKFVKTPKYNGGKRINIKKAKS